MDKRKLLVIYQVVMHYRLPLYYKLANDDNYDFTLFYGNGKKNTKLKNADFNNKVIKNKKFWTIRLPFKTNNGKGSIPLWPNLFVSLILKNADVILVEGSSSLLNGFITFIYCKIFHKKIIWWSLGKLEGREHKGFRKVLVLIEKFIAKKSNSIFTYSTQGKNYFKSIGVPDEKIFVGVNVLDTDLKLKEIQEFKKMPHKWIWDKHFNIVFIGTITSEKKIEVVLDSLKTIINEGITDIKFHIIGDGNHFSKLLNYIKNLNIEEYVIIHGRINKGASQILQNCQIMVLPGLGGLAICEGMLNHLPVITGNADGTEKDLIDNSNGFYLNEFNSVNLSNKIKYLYNNNEIRVQMGLNSFEKITTRFSFNNYYNILIGAINNSE